MLTSVGHSIAQKDTGRFTPRSEERAPLHQPRSKTSNMSKSHILDMRAGSGSNPFREPSTYADTNSRRGEQVITSGRKEPAPIIITKDEQFMYKAPSSVHETVVNTLRRERDNLSVALANQRESANSLAAKLTQMGIVNAQLE